MAGRVSLETLEAANTDLIVQAASLSRDGLTDSGILVLMQLRECWSKLAAAYLSSRAEAGLALDISAA